MKKDTFYFSHDYNAREDEKIKGLLYTHSFLGYGIYWALIEDLYNNANALRTDYKRIAFELRQDENLVKSIINDFELFRIEGGIFSSDSVSRRLDKRNEKSEKARKSAEERWKNTNAMRTHTECNAIKERKVKERKVKERKVKESKIKEKKVKKSSGEEFNLEELYELYPKKIGKKQALKHLSASVKNLKDFESCKISIINYKKIIEIEKTDYKFIKHASTFFNNWGDYLNSELVTVSSKQELKTDINFYFDYTYGNIGFEKTKKLDLRQLIKIKYPDGIMKAVAFCRTKEVQEFDSKDDNSIIDFMAEKIIERNNLNYDGLNSELKAMLVKIITNENLKTNL